MKILLNKKKFKIYSLLSYNENAICIIEKNLNKVNWYGLSSNPNAIHILEKNLDKVFWDELSFNPNAISILENNLYKINWEYFAKNPNAIQILKNNLNKIDWYYLLQNQNINQILTELDIKKMKENCKIFAEELATYVFNPNRLNNLSELYNISVYDYLENI